LDAHKGNITAVDYTRIRAWFERNGKKTTKDDVIDAVELVAKELRYNPILDYLDALPKPSPEQLATGALSCLAARALGNTDPLAQEALSKMLVASVRRMRYPGTKVDTVLVLRGRQSIRKSTFLVVLFGSKYVKSQMADLSTKDASIGLRGMWGIELAELDRVIRAESSTVKEFLSRADDDYRPPYGKTEEKFPRQCTFWGTTNDDRFLVDATGNRRFWVIEVLGYDLVWLQEHRDEIWACANALEAAGAPHWYEDEGDAKALQESYEVYDEWDELVMDFCAGRTMIKSALQFFVECVAKGDPGAVAKIDRRVQNRIWDIFRRFGLERKKIHGACWISVPEWLASRAPSLEEVARRASSKAIGQLKLMGSK
jgi:predicted P-loop ATPase